MREGLFVIGVLVGATAFACLMFILGAVFEEGSMRSSAIKAGVAHYTVNPKTGETKFEWVKPQEQAPSD